MATKFYEVSKREDIYIKIFPQLYTWSELISIKTSEFNNLIDYVDKTTQVVSSSRINFGRGLEKPKNLFDDLYKKSKQQLSSSLTVMEAELVNLQEQKTSSVDESEQKKFDLQIIFKKDKFEMLRAKLAYWNEKK
ncbi:3592_t:CDS:2 [Cetraspora pellucida]|uniref:3592_t:CDS:1 n=1 Tax=Cetraspora pellucida TaxID=1433469 RepID=A0ACA9K300_9GLOM|nr:3592_t:CDS:2 [Cetraspora pellucida]